MSKWLYVLIESKSYEWSSLFDKMCLMSVFLGWGLVLFEASGWEPNEVCLLMPLITSTQWLPGRWDAGLSALSERQSPAGPCAGR